MIRTPVRRVKRQRKTKIQQKKVQHLQQQSRLLKLPQVKHLRRKKPQQSILKQVIRSLKRQTTLIKVTKQKKVSEEEEEETVR